MLDTVTVTGADDSVNPEDLLGLVKQYPFVEFGILLGNHPGTPRFPSDDWRERLWYQAQGSKPAMIFSEHLCGRRVDLFLANDYFFDDYLVNRFQINTHGQPHAFDVARVRRNVRGANVHGQQVIFQYDQINTNALLACIGRHVTDRYTNLNVAALYDLSHGEGRLPVEWPKPLPGVYCGYAGGLSPDNVAEQLDKISELVRDRPFWIDAETHLRSDDNRVFDLEKVARFLEAACPYVIESMRAP